MGIDCFLRSPLEQQRPRSAKPNVTANHECESGTRWGLQERGEDVIFNVVDYLDDSSRQSWPLVLVAICSSTAKIGIIECNAIDSDLLFQDIHRSHRLNSPSESTKKNTTLPLAPSENSQVLITAATTQPILIWSRYRCRI